jgi:uncharacterized integral membrane protein
MYFIILIIHNLANTTFKFPEGDVLTPKDVGVILIHKFTLLICAYVDIQ